MTDPAGHRSLVAFTSLAIAGAGLVSASAFFELVHGLASAPATAAGAVLLAAGLAVSLGHLGRKRRAGLAVRRAWHSALSNEALLAGLGLTTAVIAAAMGLFGFRAPFAVAIAGSANAAFLVSIGFVYRVRGQRTWLGFSAAAPLTAGLAWGAIAAQSTADTGSVLPGTLLVIAIDALVFSQRWRDIIGIALSDAVLANPWMIRRSQLLAARLFLLDVAPFFLLGVAPTPFALPVASAGLFIDRFSFYALALQHTTEHEIADVEARIGCLDRQAQG